MAIQFPNFLAAQTHAPDYSGIGDAIENFYKGYHMPKDALIKEIQARFAEPNAKANLRSTELGNIHQEILNKYLPDEKDLSLTSGRLSNKKAQMDINRLAHEIAQQQELEKQLRMALSGGSQQGMPMMQQAQLQAGGMPPLMSKAQAMLQVSQGAPSLPGMPPGLPIPPGIPGMTMIGSPPPNAVKAVAPQQPSLAPATQEASDEVVITKGAPQLSGVDSMYDSNPLSRAFLEKKGYKKTQEVKFDKKTGQTTVLTKYPSGKITVLSSRVAPPAEDGIPLTSKMVSKHQNIISSIDNALPTIKKILDEKGIQPYARWTGLVPGLMSQSTKYQALVKSALDSLIGAYGLPMTNEGIKTVEHQLMIGHGETKAAYRKRLKELVEDLEKRKSYSANEVKKSNKIRPVGSDNDENTYSPNEWEPV